MNDGGYRGGSTPGGKWGCALASLIGIPLFCSLLLIDALGDCVPGTSCHHSFWSMVLLPSLAIALPIGFGVRWLVNRRRSGDG